MDSIFITPDLETQELVAEFTVPGEPVSKARARFTKQGSKTVSYTPQKTLDGERAVKAAYLSIVSELGTDPEAAYAVRAHFYNGTRQRRDVDNMVKLILDGLNKVAWVDDNQVLEIAARKSFVKKAEAHTLVQIFRIGDMEFPKRACLRCGTEFRTYESWENDPNSKKYCTSECFYAHSVEKRERTCGHCSKTFHAWGEAKETRFCSRECNYSSKRVTLACGHCSGEFTKPRSLVRKTNYCSDECKQDAEVIRRTERRSKHFPGTCQHCGGGTTRKEYTRCNPCKKLGAGGNPKPISE